MSKTDRVKGALYGAAIGDALGAPYEFDNPPMLEPFTYLEHHDFWQNSPGTMAYHYLQRGPQRRGIRT
jgi:ADP-ribosylglycohydrolase